jgi:glucose/arabinose dehydrogenase
MRMRGIAIYGAAAIAFFAAAGTAGADAPADIAKRIALPAGFHISVWASVPGAREMAVAPDLHAVFVSDEQDRIYAIRSEPGHRQPTVSPAITGLHAPSGVAYRDGWLYVTERTRVLRYRADKLLNGGTATPELVASGLPGASHHGTRIIAIGPDGKLYVSVGTPCNLCQPRGIQGTIQRFNAAGGGRITFARGIRNSVGIAFEPSTGVCYFTDNGVDGMGDDSPPDELNAAAEPGLDFGYPDYGGGHDRSKDWPPAPPAAPGIPAPSPTAAPAPLSASAPPQPPAPAPEKAVTFPALEFPAHVAPLGLAFYQGDMFPRDYRGDLFVAQHGSWDRSTPTGYRVVRVRFADGKPVKAEPFATGWLTADQAVLGRPADVKQAADGALLVSDDHDGVIYRISYEGR